MQTKTEDVYVTKLVGLVTGSAAARVEAKQEEAGTPSSNSPADSEASLSKVARTAPEAVGTASPAAAGAEAATVSAAEETTRKPPAGVAPKTAAAAHPAPAAPPPGMRPDARPTP